MVREVVLGVDLGTSALKAGLFTLTGEPIGGIARISYAISSNEPGAREQDPGDWWRAFKIACRQLLSEVDVQLLALAIGGQAPTLCTVDAALRPTHPAITWLDQRPGPDAERMYVELGQTVPVWGSWLSEAAWLARSRLEALRRTRWLLGSSEYLLARLTGKALKLLEWSDAELEASGVDPQLIPPLIEPGSIVGTVEASAAEASGLPAATPVVAGYFDGVLGVLGSGACRPGDACMNGGTSGTFTAVSRQGVGYPVLGMWTLGAATNTSGNALDWFAEHIAPAGGNYDELLDTVSSVSAGAHGLLFLPHLGGERQDAHVRGAWVGLTLEQDRRHLLRALLEGIAFSFRSLGEQVGHIGDVYSVGGQARSPVWNQIKADVLNRPVLVPQVVEAAVVGAALLCGISIGAYASREEAIAAMVHIAHRFDPDPARADRYDQLYAAYRGLYPRLRETTRLLHDLE